MLSAKEKRFIKYWEEQRTGGRWSYFALYIPAGTFLCGILTGFLLSLITFTGVDHFVTVIIISAVLSVAITTGTWLSNERKFKKLIHREITQGKLRDEQFAKDKAGDDQNLSQ